MMREWPPTGGVRGTCLFMMTIGFVTIWIFILNKYKDNKYGTL